MAGGQRWADRRPAAREGRCREEGQRNAEVEGAPHADGSLHEQLPRVMAGVVHAGDDFRLQRIDLRKEDDGGHTAIEGPQAGGGMLRVLLGPQRRHRARDESRDEANHLQQLGSGQMACA